MWKGALLPDYVDESLDSWFAFLSSEEHCSALLQPGKYMEV